MYILYFIVPKYLQSLEEKFHKATRRSDTKWALRDRLEQNVGKKICIWIEIVCIAHITHSGGYYEDEMV